MSRRINHENAKAAVIAERFKRAETTALVTEHHDGRMTKLNESKPSPDAYRGVYWERLQNGSIGVYLRYLNALIAGRQVPKCEYRRNGYRPKFESLRSRGDYMEEVMKSLQPSKGDVR